MGCSKSRCRDRSRQIKLFNGAPKQEKPQEDLYAPFEPDKELSKAYYDNINALRSEGMRSGILEDDTTESLTQKLDDSTSDSKAITLSHLTSLSKEKSLHKDFGGHPDSEKSENPDCDHLYMRLPHSEGAMVAFHCFPLSTFGPISEARFGCTRLATMVIPGGGPRDTILKKSSASQLGSEDPTTAALSNTEKLAQYVNGDEESVFAVESLMLGVAPNLDETSSPLHPSMGSVIQSELPLATPFSSCGVRSSKRSWREWNPPHTRQTRLFLVVAKELRFTTKHLREEVLALIKKHVLRWHTLSTHSPLLLRYLHMEYIDVNEMESLPFPNGGLCPHNASKAFYMESKRRKKKDGKGSLFNGRVARGGTGSKQRESPFTETACSTAHEVAGVRIYTELAKYGTLHTLQMHEMPSLFKRNYLHELTVRVCMREVLLGLFFLHENGELQCDLNARSIFLCQPICSIYKTYFPAYISEVPAGDLTRVPPTKFGCVLKLLNSKSSRSQELSRGTLILDANTPSSSSFHGDKENSLCNRLCSEDLESKLLGGINPNFITSGSGVNSILSTPSRNNAQPAVNKSVGFDLSRSSVFITQNGTNTRIKKGRNSGVSGPIKTNSARQKETPARKSSLSVPNSVSTQGATKSEDGVGFTGRAPRLPLPRGQSKQWWDNLTFRQIEQAYGCEEYDPPSVPLLPSKFDSRQETTRAGSGTKASTTLKIERKGSSVHGDALALCEGVTPSTAGGAVNQRHQTSPGVISLLAATTPAPPPLLLAPYKNDSPPSRRRYNSSISHLSTTAPQKTPSQISRWPTLTSNETRSKSSAGWEGPPRSSPLIRLSQASAIRHCMALEKGSYAKLEEVPPQHFLSIAHAAPEVIINRQFSPASDIYAFAMTFIELVTPGGQIMAECRPNRSSAGKLQSYNDEFAASLGNWYREKIAAFTDQGPTNTSDSVAPCVSPTGVRIPAHLSDECKKILWRCLHTDPQKRPTAVELLQKKYFLFGGWISQRNANGNLKGVCGVQLPEDPWDGNVNFERIAKEAGFPLLPSKLYAPLPGLAS